MAETAVKKCFLQYENEPRKTIWFDAIPENNKTIYRKNI